MGIPETAVDVARRADDPRSDARRRNASRRQRTARRDVDAGARGRRPEPRQLARHGGRQPHAPFPDLAVVACGVDGCGCRDHESHLDDPLPTRSRPGVVLRSHGTIRRPTGGRVPDRFGGDAVIDDRYLVVRAVAIYSAAIALALAAAWRRPDRRATAGAMLAFAWNLCTLFVLHLIALRAGWWRYDADGGTLLGIPVDLWFAWAILWGPATAIAMPRTPLWIVTAVALGLDLIAMPLAAPVVQLGSTWLLGEGAALAVC